MNEIRATATRRLTARAPVRADLAGGTLDLWPLGLLHPGAITIAVAVELRVEVEVAPPRRRGMIELVSTDLRATRTARAGAAVRVGRSRLELLERLARAVGPENGVAVSARSPVRAGSGLGTSSSLGVATAAALLAARGARWPSAGLVRLVRDVEAQILRIPTGTQDHWAAVRGGIVILEHRPGEPRIQRLGGPLLQALARRLLVVDSGRGRSSGPSNWDLYRRRIDGEPAAARAFARIARSGARAAVAVASGDWRALGRAMSADLDARADCSPLVLTERLGRMLRAAREAGALGARVCGAGGGGFAVVLTREADRRRVGRVIEENGGSIVDARPTGRGLTVAPVSQR